MNQSQLEELFKRTSAFTVKTVAQSDMLLATEEFDEMELWRLEYGDYPGEVEEEKYGYICIPVSVISHYAVSIRSSMTRKMAWVGTRMHQRFNQRRVGSDRLNRQPPRLHQWTKTRSSLAIKSCKSPFKTNLGISFGCERKSPCQIWIYRHTFGFRPLRCRTPGSRRFCHYRWSKKIIWEG